jgi:hypothetical protein
MSEEESEFDCRQLSCGTQGCSKAGCKHPESWLYGGGGFIIIAGHITQLVVSYMKYNESGSAGNTEITNWWYEYLPEYTAWFFQLIVSWAEWYQITRASQNYGLCDRYMMKPRSAMFAMLAAISALVGILGFWIPSMENLTLSTKQTKGLDLRTGAILYLSGVFLLFIALITSNRLYHRGVGEIKAPERTTLIDNQQTLAKVGTLRIISNGH